MDITNYCLVIICISISLITAKLIDYIWSKEPLQTEVGK